MSRILMPKPGSICKNFVMKIRRTGLFLDRSRIPLAFCITPGTTGIFLYTASQLLKIISMFSSPSYDRVYYCLHLQAISDTLFLKGR